MCTQTPAQHPSRCPRQHCPALGFGDFPRGEVCLSPTSQSTPAYGILQQGRCQGEINNYGGGAGGGVEASTKPWILGNEISVWRITHCAHGFSFTQCWAQGATGNMRKERGCGDCGEFLGPGGSGKDVLLQ